MQIKDRTFIVSGGSSGLGLATTTLLLSHGANVSILDLNPPPPSSSTSATSPSTTTDPSRTLFTKTDVSSTTSLQSALDSTLQWICTTSKPLAGVICCAGIGTASLALPRQPSEISPPSPSSSSSSTNVKTMDMAIFDRVISINLRGTVDLIRLCLPHLALNNPWGPDNERGVVIVVSSVAAYEGQVGQLAYSASKGAVRSIVLPLARELGQKAGIRVMGVAPGVFETGMTVPPRSKSSAPSKRNESVSGADLSLEVAGKEKEAKKREGEQQQKKEKSNGPGVKAAVNPEMVQFPTRMGKNYEFAELVKHIVENPMLNGGVIRLDGGVRMPSRL